MTGPFQVYARPGSSPIGHTVRRVLLHARIASMADRERSIRYGEEGPPSDTRIKTGGRGRVRNCEAGVRGRRERADGERYGEEAEVHIWLESFAKCLFARTFDILGGRFVAITMLKTPHLRRALIVGCGLQMFQQVSGINTVM